ncbi:MAG: RidA family protein [Nitrospiraceae bacterium]|nr:MAG: RidA family protein [Nitrospiraceae bacterium]
MAGKKVFFTRRAPEPKGPYSQAVIHDSLLYLSGQIPVDPSTGELVRSTIEEETETVLNNIRIITEEAGANMDCVLRVTCYLADMLDFPRFNEVYEKYFSQYPPARTTIQAARLPLDVQVEMDAIVALPSRKPRHGRPSGSGRPRNK